MKRKLYIKFIVTLLVNCSILFGLSSVGFCNGEDIKLSHDYQPKVTESKNGNN